MSPCRIAVVSPFIDKRHGTERRVAEWISRLGDACEIHIYSERIEDIDLSKVVWHRVPRIPGPHLFKFLWWFVANQLWRWRDRRFRHLHYDLVFTPGTNCLDADIISVHIVFAEFYREVKHELSLRRNPLRFWPLLLHRRLYYRLITFLEHWIYTDERKTLVLIARKTANDIKKFYGRTDNFPVVYLGLDHQTFRPEARKARRCEMRNHLGLQDKEFVLLLIGNDWTKKGLPALLEALQRLKQLPLSLLVAGQDDPRPYQAQIQKTRLDGKVHFLRPRADVIAYYAAADAYVGPSVEDTFAQPPAEAMACGLPVITSSANGTSEIMTDGVDGLILQDARNSEDLAAKIRLLYEDSALRDRLGENAAQTAQKLTWERNGEEIRAIFEESLARKQQTDRSA